MADSLTTSLPVARLPLAAWRRRPVALELLVLAACVFVTLAGNGFVWNHALAERPWGDPGTWRYAACLFAALVAFQAGALLLAVPRCAARSVIAVLMLTSAVASHFIDTYHVFIDAGMLRNVLATDRKEALELVSLSLAWRVLWQGVLPAVLVWTVTIDKPPLKRALWRRGAALLAAVAVFGAALLIVFHDAAGLVRNHRELRHVVTPANVVYALLKVVRQGVQPAAAQRIPIATDAVLGPSWAANPRPVLFVIVVGETVRAANWGLNGYERQTTPGLAALDVVNYPDVTACGTDTQTSLPCMFSPWGRHDYDAARIRDHESLLHVLNHVKLPVLWRDNQSGCKGVCAGLEEQRLDRAAVPGLCAGGQCFDEVLLQDLHAVLAQRPGSRVLVLHQLGNHGPAYHARYPQAFRRYQPTCDTGELRHCTREQIVNAYDNAILYTDHVLSSAIGFLRQHEGSHDSALIYVSDHGESLGEHNVYLHGMPYVLAPRDQTAVPMTMWLSHGFMQRLGLDLPCLHAQAAAPASHDNLFHTVLGLLDVRTASYDAALDLTRRCRH